MAEDQNAPEWIRGLWQREPQFLQVIPAALQFAQKSRPIPRHAAQGRPADPENRDHRGDDLYAPILAVMKQLPPWTSIP